MFLPCLLLMARELGNKLPLTTSCHVQLEMASAWDLSKQLRTLKGKGCLPVAPTILCAPLLCPAQCSWLILALEKSATR